VNASANTTTKTARSRAQSHQIGFLCLGRKIGEKVKSWFLGNLGAKLSQMHPK